ncbi:ATP-binding protein [Chitinophaga sedimenti]|nr:hypothetical protein [Chitinophaga sedimenti]
MGFPLVIRPSFTLGGTGGGFVHSRDELDEAPGPRSESFSHPRSTG